MRIRIKLLFLIIGNLALFGLVIGAYLLILGPIDRMEEERQVITRLRESFVGLQAAANRITVMPVQTSKPILDRAVAEFKSAFDAIAAVRYVTELNPEVKAAVDGIQGLKEISLNVMVQFDRNTADLYQDAATIFASDPGITAFRMYSMALAPGADAETAGSRVRTGNALNSINRLNTILEKSAETLAGQFGVIQQEMDRARQRSYALVATLIPIVVVLSLIGAGALALSISRAFRRSSQQVNRIAAGDFTFSFDTSRRDEFSRLGQDLNGLLESLNESLGRIQAGARENQRAKDELLLSVESATASTTEISANSKSIHDRMIDMDARVSVTRHGVDDIAGAIQDFDQMVITQGQHVDQAAAKVRDMVGLLKVVGDYAMKDRETSVALVRVSEKSQAAIDDTFARVAAMAESVSSIMEIANVISDIAMQTNMLAMNASIEAAHAGEFGRGFSVVASEISKLASASATSSEEIARNIKAVVTRINETTLSREQSQVALDAIKGQIDQVAESSRAIFESVQSLQAGSGQIIGSMEVLRAGSAEQRQRFSGIGGSTGQITASVGELERISSEVVSNIGEITAGLEEIRNSVDSTAAAAELVGTISDDLTASVGRFRTRDAKAPD